MLELIMLVGLLIMFTWSAWIEVAWIAAIAVILYLAGNWLFGDISHLSFLLDPITLISIAVFFLAAGTAWSLWKWRRHMLSNSVQKSLREGKYIYDRQKEKVCPFKESVAFPSKARPSRNIEKIVTWIMLWPFSMMVYFFEDFLMDIGRWIYNRLGNVYVRITDSTLPEDMK
jgi:hypothetical protein